MRHVWVLDKGTLSQLSYLSRGFTSILIMNHKLGPYRSLTAAEQTEYLLHNLALKECVAIDYAELKCTTSEGL